MSIKTKRVFKSRVSKEVGYKKVLGSDRKKLSILYIKIVKI